MDNLEIASHRMALELLSATDVKTHRSSALYEFIPLSELFEYTQLQDNSCILENDILMRISFTKDGLHGEYQFELHNTLPDQLLKINATLRLFNNETRIQKIEEIQEVEIKPLQMISFGHKYSYQLDHTHLTVEIIGSYTKTVPSPQKDVLKMQAFINQCQQQEKNILDVLNGFQQALQSARSGVSNKTFLKLNLQCSTSMLKLATRMPFTEKHYLKISNPNDYSIALEKRIEILNIENYNKFYQPYKGITKFSAVIHRCAMFKFFILLEEDLICVFFKKKHKMSITQIQYMVHFGQQLIRYLKRSPESQPTPRDRSSTHKSQQI